MEPLHGILMQTASPLTAADLRTILAGYRFRFSTEEQLHAGMEDVMAREGLRWEHERHLSTGRIDFLVESGIGIEVKVDGSRAALLRQISRYLLQSEVRELLVITTRASHSEIPMVMHGKTVRVLYLSPGML